ncbi:MAG: hypothetical protein P4K94_06565 [Terracidiphilus sp.]|nr:hypothetical protein [Terracidiphilus sp.]
MKRLLVLASLICASACGLYAQVVDTTVCDILKNPVSFNGKMVRIKGTVTAGFDQFAIKDVSCAQDVNSIWLAYPEKSKAKAGPAAIVQMQPARNFGGTYTAPTRTPVSLQKDGEFKNFDSLLATPHDHGNGICIGCSRFEVTATLVGRLDGVASAAITRDATGRITGLGGFGNMNAYAARLVLQSVSGVTSKEIDYSKTDYMKGHAVSKGPTTVMSSHTVIQDPLFTLQQFATGLGGATGAADIQRAADAYGPHGSHVGVNVAISYNETNEASEKLEVQSGVESPDGVIYDCAFNHNRLEGDALILALVHIGKHAADVRAPLPGAAQANLFANEYNSWIITAEVAAINRQNSLSLPGGFEIWNTEWAADNPTEHVDEGVTGYLTKEAFLIK